jgi:hypothetical protein
MPWLPVASILPVRGLQTIVSLPLDAIILVIYIDLEELHSFSIFLMLNITAGL